MYSTNSQLNNESQGQPKFFWMVVRYMLIILFIAGGMITPTPASASSWSDQIVLDESCFPTSTTTLLSGNGSTFVLSCDIYIGSGGSGVQPIAGADGIDDLVVTGTIVESPNNNWSQVEGDYATSSSGSFRSDYTIAGCSGENMWAYVKFDFAFTGALSSIQANQFATRHTSANGSSEAYEYTLITLNGSSNAVIESGLNASTYNNQTHYQSGTTISEHLLSVSRPNSAGGGQMATGVWAVDDFNTNVLPSFMPEAVTTNPGADNGRPNDNQTLSGNGSFGLADGTVVSSVTYYFGLQDVAFDTNGDGCTQTNTLPSAGVTYFDIGYEETTAVELASFDAQRDEDATSSDTTVSWTTAAEINSAGFNIYGGSSANGPWTRLNQRLIPAAGGPITSTNYRFTDSAGAAFYMLEDVDTSGAITRHGPVGVGHQTAGTAADEFSLFFPLLQR